MIRGIIVIANPDIIELQSDRATPGSAWTITLRRDVSGKAALENMKKETSGNGEVLADNVSTPTKVVAQRRVRLRSIRRFLSKKKRETETEQNFM